MVKKVKPNNKRLESKSDKKSFSFNNYDEVLSLNQPYLIEFFIEIFVAERRTGRWTSGKAPSGHSQATKSGQETHLCGVTNLSKSKCGPSLVPHPTREVREAHIGVRLIIHACKDQLQVKGRPKVDFSWARSPAPQPQSRSPLAAVQVGESEFCSPLVAALSTPPVPCQVCITMVMSEILTRTANVVLKCDFDCDYNWLFRLQ